MLFDDFISVFLNHFFYLLSLPPSRTCPHPLGGNGVPMENAHCVCTLVTVSQRAIIHINNFNYSPISITLVSLSPIIVLNSIFRDFFGCGISTLEYIASLQNQCFENFQTSFFLISLLIFLLLSILTFFPSSSLEIAIKFLLCSQYLQFSYQFFLPLNSFKLINLKFHRCHPKMGLPNACIMVTIS